ncbi:6-phosphogluconate dehydrogenase [Actinoplanes italicus]|nr:NAD(P)-binding domain-containing protein [Actinoplanes italicus]GIE28222.1 6-phosphogluconate dehydrogenase [Actinoplanes italicus]
MTTTLPMTTADRIAVIGTGAIGTAITHRLLTTGHPVTVWNRTPDRTTTLTAAGAHRAATPAEAVTSATLTLLTLTDYTAVHQVLDTLPPGLDGHTIAALCTGTPDDARTAAHQATHRGARYLDAGVQAGPDAFTTGTATVLYSGDRTAFDQHTETLARLGPPRFVGDTPHAAAVWDLTLFGLWYDAHLGLLRALDTARTAGIDLDEFAATATTQLGHVVTAVPATVSELRTGHHPPGPATLPEHLTVVRQLLTMRAGTTLGDGGLPAVAARIEALLAQGRHQQGLTATID